MTRASYMAQYADPSCPFERACEEPGRRRRRNDLPAASFLGDEVAAEYGDAASVRATGGIVRPDRRSPMRAGRYRRMWVYDPIAAGE